MNNPTEQLSELRNIQKIVGLSKIDAKLYSEKCKYKTEKVIISKLSPS